MILAATAAAAAAAFATRAATARATATTATACGFALKGIGTDVAPGRFRGVSLMRSIGFSTAASTSATAAAAAPTTATVTPSAKSRGCPTSSTVWFLYKPFVIGLLHRVRNRTIVRQLLARRTGLLHGALVKSLLQRVGDRAVFR